MPPDVDVEVEGQGRGAPPSGNLELPARLTKPPLTAKTWDSYSLDPVSATCRQKHSQRHASCGTVIYFWFVEKQTWAGVVAQVLEILSSKCKVLSSNLSTTPPPPQKKIKQA
jgi:hypothetical protein